MKAAGKRLLLGLLALIVANFSMASSQTLVVYVRDGQTGDPLEGAFVMVGLAEGLPFHGNI